MKIASRIKRIATRACFLTSLATFPLSALPASTQQSAPQTTHSIRPQAKAYSAQGLPPKNLARWYRGASLILVNKEQFQHIHVTDVGDYDEALFLSDNSALSYNIQAGSHDYIIDLGQAKRVSRFFLNNQSAAGSFRVLCADTLDELESEEWIQLSQAVDFASGVIPSVTFPSIEIRYILIRFDIQSAGSIGNFGVTGERS